MFSSLTCADLLAHSEERKLTLRVELSLGVLAIGRIDVRRGQPVHAEMPGATGDAALLLMARLPHSEARLSFVVESDLPSTTISAPWRSLLAPQAASPDRSRALETAFGGGHARLGRAHVVASQHTTSPVDRAVPASERRVPSSRMPSARAPIDSDLLDTTRPPDDDARATTPRSTPVPRARRPTPLGVPTARPRPDIGQASPCLAPRLVAEPPATTPQPPANRAADTPPASSSAQDLVVPEVSGRRSSEYEQHFERATRAYLRRDYDEALEYFELCAAIRPDDTLVRHNIQRLRQRTRPR